MTQTQSAAPLNAGQSSPYRWVVLFVATAIQTGTSFVSQAVAALMPFLVSQLHLSNAQVALSVGAVNFGMALTSIPFGQWVDRFGEKVILVAGSVLTGMSVLAASFTRGFWWLLVCLLFTGVCAASSTPAGSKAIMTWFPYSMRALAISIRQTGVAAGGFLAALILPAIATRSDWRHGFVTASVSAMAVSLACGFAYRERASRRERADGWRPNRQLRLLLRSRSLWLASAGTTAYLGAQFVILGYSQLFLHEQVQMSVYWTSVVLALVLFMGIVGRVIWGMVSDRLFAGARKPVMLLIGGIAAAECLLMLCVRAHTPGWLIAVLFACFGFSATGWNGVWVTWISELAGREQAGTAVGLGMTVLQVGSLLYPLLFGALIDHFHSYSVSWVVLFAIVCLGALTLWRVPDRPADRAAAPADGRAV